MSRYIDADIAKEKLKEYCIDDDSTVQYWYDLMGIDDCIDEIIPTADVRENVRGEWLNMERIEDDKSEYITEWQQAQCSVCHKWHTTPYMYFFTHYNFCSNCGAPMTGETT